MNNFLLKSYLKCKRKAWLDFKADKQYKSWSAQNAIQNYVEFKTFEKYTGSKLFSGIKGCEEGYVGVLGMKMKHILKNDLEILVNPSILIKVKGKSIWGRYKYIPAISKLGNRTTKEHLFDLALSSIALEKFQNSKVEHGLVFKRYKNQIKVEKIFLKDKLKDKAVNIFSELNNSLIQNIPEITENRKKCSICYWQKYCDNEAKLKGYLTDIDGIGLNTSKFLKKLGIQNINQLATFNKNELEQKLLKYHDKNITKYSKFIDQSIAYKSGSAISLPNRDKYLKIFFEANPGFLIFDIESNPDENHDFLYGLLSISNIWQNSKDDIYEPILNLKNEKKIISNPKILTKLISKKNWPILHYGDTEKIAIIKLAREANFFESEIEILKSRFIDLHLIVRKSWILPLKNYSLKTVANWVGFNWEQNNVSGSKALFWWLQYQDNQTNIFLEKIIKYNKDDCLATLHIARWLLNNLKYNFKEK